MALTYERAARIIETAISKAEELNTKMAFAVMDLSAVSYTHLTLPTKA